MSDISDKLFIEQLLQQKNIRYEEITLKLLLSKLQSFRAQGMDEAKAGEAMVEFINEIGG